LIFFGFIINTSNDNVLLYLEAKTPLLVLSYVFLSFVELLPLNIHRNSLKLQIVVGTIELFIGN